MDLCIETTIHVGQIVGHLSDTVTPLYKDHLPTATTVSTVKLVLATTCVQELPVYRDHCLYDEACPSDHLRTRTTCLQRPL